MIIWRPSIFVGKDSTTASSANRLHAITLPYRFAGAPSHDRETQRDFALSPSFEKANQAAEFYLIVAHLYRQTNLISLTSITFCFFFCLLEDLLFS